MTSAPEILADLLTMRCSHIPFPPCHACMFDCRLKQLWPKMAEGSEQPKKLPRQLNLWSEEAMARAVVACLEQKQIGGSHTLRHIAKEYGIPSSTLERRVNGKVAGTSHNQDDQLLSPVQKKMNSIRY